MSRHQVDIPAGTIDDLEHALHTLRNAGAPDDAQLRIRCRTSFNPDGGTAKTLTASWNHPS